MGLMLGRTRRRLCRFFALAIGLAAATFAASRSFAAPPAPAAAGGALQKARATKVTATWQGQSLRRAITRLTSEPSVGFVLDRRIDPDRPISLSLKDETLDKALADLAAAGGAELCWFADLAYIGPSETVRELRTLAALRLDEARKTPKPRSKILLAKRPKQWEDFAEPKALVEEFAREAGLKAIGVDQVPHDLWGAASLPPMTAMERLTVVLAQFDLSFRLNAAGDEIDIEPISRPVQLARTYDGGADAEQTLEKLRRLAPDGEMAIEQGKIVVRGRLEDHERLAGEAAPRRDAAPSKKKNKGAQGKKKGADKPRQVHTLAVRQTPLRAVLEKLKADLSLELHVDQASLDRRGLSLDTPVTFSVERATLQELLTAALKDAGVKFKLSDKRLDVFAE